MHILNNLGYDKHLNNFRSRSFTFVLHSDPADGPLQVQVSDAINSDLDNKANQLILE